MPAVPCYVCVLEPNPRAPRPLPVSTDAHRCTVVHLIYVSTCSPPLYTLYSCVLMLSRWCLASLSLSISLCVSFDLSARIAASAGCALQHRAPRRLQLQGGKHRRAQPSGTGIHRMPICLEVEYHNRRVYSMGIFSTPRTSISTCDHKSCKEHAYTRVWARARAFGRRHGKWGALHSRGVTGE